MSWGVVVQVAGISSAIFLPTICASDEAHIFSGTNKLLTWNDTHILKICFSGYIDLEAGILKNNIKILHCYLLLKLRNVLVSATVVYACKSHTQKSFSLPKAKPNG